MTTQQKLDVIRMEIANRLDLIDRQVIQEAGLHMPRLTLIARDPSKPGMVIVVTSEPNGGLEEAFEQVRNNAK